MALVVLTAVTLCPVAGRAQFGEEPGHSIGTVTTRGHLILLTLNEGALGRANLFNLAHRTLRFTPDGTGYRVQNVALTWDADFGSALTGPVVLRKFAFPFSGKTWTSLSVGMTGTIAFAQMESGEPQMGDRGVSIGREGGLSIDRFAELQDAASEIVNTVPAISVFFKPRMSGKRYLKEVDDRAVITWDLTEPFAGIQDWTWTPTINRFQAVLHKDGMIEFSYDDVAARDAIVGVYPLVPAGDDKTIDSIPLQGNATEASNLDIRRITLRSLNDLFLKIVLTCAAPCSPPPIPPLPVSVTSSASTNRCRKLHASQTHTATSSGRSAASASAHLAPFTAARVMPRSVPGSGRMST
jgi:hypothetical protein